MRTLMNVLLLLIFLVMIFYCSPRPVPAGPPPSAPMTNPQSPPQAIVAGLAHRHGVPYQVAMEVWWKECRNLLLGEGRCRNLSSGERSEWQITRAAAEYQAVGCNYLILGTPGTFHYATGCALKLLAQWEARCRARGYRKSWDAAMGAYNTGDCAPNAPYVREIQARRQQVAAQAGIPVLTMLGAQP